MISAKCLIGLSVLLFFISVFGFVTRHNLLATLIPVELVLNSADISSTVFNCILFPEQLEGSFFTPFSTDISVAETAAMIVITISVYRNFDSDQVNGIENVKL